MRLIILFLLPIFVYAQKIDTVISTGVYKAYFNYQLKEPVYVSYDLYKGGGDCNRSKFYFYNNTKIKTATSKDYAGSGYDKGHLANAEDFAYDCVKDELTFRYYNCLPQTPNLNRGVWKYWEEIIRKESQKQPLKIICGGQFLTNKMIGSIAVPDYCWKVVVNTQTSTILYAIYFTNKEFDNSAKLMKLQELEKLLGYTIPIK